MKFVEKIVKLSSNSNQILQTHIWQLIAEIKTL